MNLLLIDDEKEFVKATKKLLELNHHRVDIAYNGQKGLQLAKKKKYDVILLDIMLPKIDGFKVAKKLRNQELITPIIMLTAKSMIEDRVKGLDSGADDYLVKPFSINELLARIRAVTRREKHIRPSVLKAGGLVLNPASHKVYRNSKLIHLNNKEYQILTYFLRNKDKVITREEIGQMLWGKKKFKSNTIDVHIRYLRRKINSGFKTKFIHTIRGQGYCLEK